MRDDEFERLLCKYLEPPGDPNPEMRGVRVEWVRDNPDFGSRHADGGGPEASRLAGQDGFLGSDAARPLAGCRL